MSKRWIMALLLGVAACGLADGVPQTTCPVMGGKVDRKLFVDVEGYRIYLCCEGCAGEIEGDPKKYIERMQAEGIELDWTPEKKAGCGGKK